MDGTQIARSKAYSINIMELYIYMKKFNYFLVLVLIALSSVSFAAPRGAIQTKAVTPNTLSQFTTNSISNGLPTVAKGTYSYLAPFNFGDTSTISSVDRKSTRLNSSHLGI